MAQSSLSLQCYQEKIIMSKFITIIECFFITAFIFYTIQTNDQPCSRFYFLSLEVSAVSIYHLYEKSKRWFKNF